MRKTENDFNEHIKIIEQYLEERIWNLSQFSEDYRPMEVNRIVQILPSCKELRAYLIQQYPGKRFIKDDVSDFKDIFLGDKQSLEQYAFHHLKNRQEISNQVFIMGTLCMEPEYYANEDSRLQTCQFPIASNRLRRIKEDGLKQGILKLKCAVSSVSRISLQKAVPLKSYRIISNTLMTVLFRKVTVLMKRMV